MSEGEVALMSLRGRGGEEGIFKYSEGIFK